VPGLRGQPGADEEAAAQLHEFAAGAYPFVNKLKLGLYARTPGMRKQGSLFPTQQGIPLAKDAWLMGIGLGLVIDDLTDRPGPKHQGLTEGQHPGSVRETGIGRCSASLTAGNCGSTLERSSPDRS
jgi:hypothetical protein